MTILEAVSRVKEISGKCSGVHIRRKKWFDYCSIYIDMYYTTATITLTISDPDNGYDRYSGWIPSCEDIVADDWEIIATN